MSAPPTLDRIVFLLSIPLSESGLLMYSAAMSR